MNIFWLELIFLALIAYIYIGICYRSYWLWGSEKKNPVIGSAEYKKCGRLNLGWPLLAFGRGDDAKAFFPNKQSKKNFWGILASQISMFLFVYIAIRNTHSAESSGINMLLSFTLAQSLVSLWTRAIRNWYRVFSN